MHVFITGGTGLIGSAVVAELLRGGHTALALARSDQSARKLEHAGATPLRGELADLDVLQAGAAQAEAVIHLAYGHDSSTAEAVARCVAEDSAALAALGGALIGTDLPLVAVSGTPWVPGRASTETDPLSTTGVVGERARAVNVLLELAVRGVRSTAVRMPRTVHGGAAGGFVGLLISTARRTGTVTYPADGAQRWPAVHVLDAAVLFRLALESAPAGTVWHAVSDEGDAVEDIATVIGRRLDMPVEARPASSFGPFGPILAMDQPASSAHTRALLGWQSTRPSQLDELESIQP